MALTVKASGFRNLSRLITRLQGTEARIWRCMIRKLQTGSRGVRRLAKAVPVDTGRLAGSFRVLARYPNIEVGTIDPAAGWIRYKKKRRYGATTVRGTLRGWRSKDMIPIFYQCRTQVFRAIERGR